MEQAATMKIETFIVLMLNAGASYGNFMQCKTLLLGVFYEAK
jgi:hypothetical protein